MTVMNENRSGMCTVLCKTLLLNEHRPHSKTTLNLRDVDRQHFPETCTAITYKSLQVVDLLWNPQPSVSVFAFP